MTEPLLTPKDVAVILRVSVGTARSEMRKMDYIEIGGAQHPRLRVSRAALDDYLRVKPPLSSFREPRRKVPKPAQSAKTGKTPGRLIEYRRS